MSRERYDDTVAQELERDLRAALALEPSPDFGRRVRARIEQDTARRARIASGWHAALAAAAMCVLAMGIGWRVTQDNRAAAPAAPIATRAATDVELGPARSPIAPARTARTHPRTARTLAPLEPEVIVPPDRGRALARLLALARSGVVGEESLRPAASAAAPAALDVTPLVVPSIPLPPIDIQSGAAGAGRE